MPPNFLNLSPCFFRAVRSTFALHFPFDSLEIASQAPCVQYMTRTNAENHFATTSRIPSQNGTPRLAASLDPSHPRRQIHNHRRAATICPRQSADRVAGHCRQIRTRRADFSSLKLKIPSLVLRAQSMTRTPAELTLRHPHLLSSEITETSDTICPGRHADALPRRGSSPVWDSLSSPMHLLHHSQLH